jgi:hypothetical protein
MAKQTWKAQSVSVRVGGQSKFSLIDQIKSCNFGFLVKKTKGNVSGHWNSNEKHQLWLDHILFTEA